MVDDEDTSGSEEVDEDDMIYWRKISTDLLVEDKIRQESNGKEEMIRQESNGQKDQ